MKFRRIIAVALLLCMCFSLAACKSGKSEAEKVVTDFMTALTTYDLDAISKCVEDIPDNSGSVYKHDIFTSDHYRDLYAKANESLAYTITSANAKEVTVKVTMPDIYTLYQNTFTSVLSQAFESEDMLDYILDEENDPALLIIALMINEIETNGIDTVEEEVTLSMNKINGEYKISADEQLELIMTNKLCLTQKETVETEPVTE